MAAECVDKIVGWVGATFCIGLNSLPSVGGNTVAGPVPGNDGDTAMKMSGKKWQLINYLFDISMILSKFGIFNTRAHFIHIIRFIQLFSTLVGAFRFDLNGSEPN